MAHRRARARAKALARETVDGTDKTAVRISVDVDGREVTWWSDFVAAHGTERRWLRAVERGRAPESWWVVSRSVLASEVTTIATQPAAARYLRAVSRLCHTGNRTTQMSCSEGKRW